MPDLATATTLTAGLFAQDEVGAPVPLTGVSVEGTITGLCARVSVAHRYRNAESTPIEAVYVFPLDDGAAVCGFEAIIDGVSVVAEVQEREKAFERYDEAIEQGHGAFLLDEERPDVFRASVGNLAAGKEVLVRITYVTELPVDGGRLRFTLPTTIAPRYAPSEDQRGVGRPEAEAVNPPVAWQVPYGLHLALRVEMPTGITGLASPSHPVTLDLADGHAVVSLATQDAALDRDFVLTADAAVLQTPQLWVEGPGEAGDEMALAVAFAPDLPATTSASEIVFVVDRSGSMGGSSIAEVRNALQLCLRTLTEGCWFNIVGFGSSYSTLFPESRAYDEASLTLAARYVESLDADLGGTEILPALTFVLGQSSRPGLPRQVVVLTDGEVTNTDAVIALVRQHRQTSRVFTFGIGAAASQHLVRGLARAGGGTAEFIHPGERIEATVTRQVARLLSPAVTDVRIEWVGGSVRPVPAVAPPIFRDQRLLAYAYVTGAVPTAVRLSGNGPSGPLAWDVPIGAGARHADQPAVSVERVGAIATLAARALIRELEESDTWLTDRGSQQRDRRLSAVRQQVIDLSVRYGLLSRETSFVAIEHRATPLIGNMQLRRIPVSLAHGWGGRAAVSTSKSSRRAIDAPFDALSWASGTSHSFDFADDGMARMELRATPAPRDATLAGLRRAVAGNARRTAAQVAWRVRSTATPAVRPAGLDALVKLQSAAGAWELDDALALVIGRSIDDLRSAMPDGRMAREALTRAWATAVALAWLERHAAANEGEWRAIAIKARRWLERQFAADTHEVDTWQDAARSWLGWPIRS